MSSRRWVFGHKDRQVAALTAGLAGLLLRLDQFHIQTHGDNVFARAVGACMAETQPIPLKVSAVAVRLGDDVVAIAAARVDAVLIAGVLATDSQPLAGTRSDLNRLD